MEIKIAPAIMDADLAHLADTIIRLEEAGADLLHVDIMDGHFVPSFVGGLRVVAAVKRNASVPVDVHLMVSNPGRAVPWFIDAGADIVFFHPEAADDAAAVVGQIHQAGRKAGVALKPDMAAECIEPFAAELDCVMAMTVNPGFSGQKFIPQVMEKISRTRKLVGAKIDIQVDGGVTPDNAADVAKAGANILVAGSAVFSKPDYGKAIAALRGTKA